MLCVKLATSCVAYIIRESLRIDAALRLAVPRIVCICEAMSVVSCSGVTTKARTFAPPATSFAADVAPWTSPATDVSATSSVNFFSDKKKMVPLVLNVQSRFSRWSDAISIASASARARTALRATEAVVMMIQRDGQCTLLQIIFYYCFICPCPGASARLLVPLLHTLETQRLSDAAFTNRHAPSIEPCPVQEIDTQITLETVICNDPALLGSVKIAKHFVCPLAATCRSP
jgi:hypothetical protein